MANGINKVILIGRIGQDPDIRYLPSGGAVANFSLATSEKLKDKQTGQPVEKTEWHKCVAFNKLADIIRDYVNKGALIYVEGQLKTRQWEQDGLKRYTTEIVINQMQMLGGRQDNQQGGQQGQQGKFQHNQEYQQSQSFQQPQQQQSCDDNNFDDDIPF